MKLTVITIGRLSEKISNCIFPTREKIAQIKEQVKTGLLIVGPEVKVEQFEIDEV